MYRGKREAFKSSQKSFLLGRVSGRRRNTADHCVCLFDKEAFEAFRFARTSAGRNKRESNTRRNNLNQIKLNVMVAGDTNEQDHGLNLPIPLSRWQLPDKAFQGC